MGTCQQGNAHHTNSHQDCLLATPRRRLRGFPRQLEPGFQARENLDGFRLANQRLYAFNPAFSDLRLHPGFQMRACVELDHDRVIRGHSKLGTQDVRPQMPVEAASHCCSSLDPFFMACFSARMDAMGDHGRDLNAEIHLGRVSKILLPQYEPLMSIKKHLPSRSMRN